MKAFFAGKFVDFRFGAEMRCQAPGSCDRNASKNDAADCLANQHARGAGHC